jgi:hypothetical protein
MYTRRLMAVFLVVGVALAGNVVSAAPAAAAICEGHVGVTYQDGHFVRGHGSIDNSCSPTAGPVRVTIQRFWGLDWTAVSQKVIYGGGAQADVSFNCEGYGTQTWRTSVNWQTMDGSPRRKLSNEIRFYCG